MGLFEALLPVVGDIAGRATKNPLAHSAILGASMVPSAVENSHLRQEELSQLPKQDLASLYPHLSPSDIQMLTSSGPSAALSGGLKTLGQGLTWFAPGYWKLAGAGLTGLAGGLEGMQTASITGKPMFQEILEGAVKGTAASVPDLALGMGVEVLPKLVNSLKKGSQ